MRFGVTLPDDGPLTAIEPLAAAVRAAERLGYDALWARTVTGLTVAAAGTGRLALGLLLADPAPADVSHVVSEARALLGPRLVSVIVKEDDLAAARAGAPFVRLLAAGPRPTNDPRADGWAPRWEPDAQTPWSGATVLRVRGPDPVHQVEEVLVDPGPVLRLDDLLSCWATVAEAVGFTPGAPPPGTRP